MARTPLSPRLTLTALDGRELPSAVLPAAPEVQPAAACLPAGTYTGPLGGTLTVTTAQQGATITETLSYVGPNGRTATAVGTLTLDVRAGVLTCTYIVTGPAGRQSTGEVMVAPGQSGSFSVTGPAGRTLTVDVAITSIGVNVTLTGPAGRSVSYTFPR